MSPPTRQSRPGRGTGTAQTSGVGTAVTTESTRRCPTCAGAGVVHLHPGELRLALLARVAMPWLSGGGT